MGRRRPGSDRRSDRRARRRPANADGSSARSGAATTPSRRVESDVKVSNGWSGAPARIAAARSAGSGGHHERTEATPRPRSPSGEAEATRTSSSRPWTSSRADASCSAAAASRSGEVDPVSPAIDSRGRSGPARREALRGRGERSPRSPSGAPVFVMTSRAAPPCCARARKPGVASMSASAASSIVASNTSRSAGLGLRGRMRDRRGAAMRRSTTPAAPRGCDGSASPHGSVTSSRSRRTSAPSPSSFASKSS